MVENDKNTVKSFIYCVDDIRNYGTTDNVPGFEKYFTNFDYTVNNYADRLNDFTDACLVSFEDTSKSIDSAQNEIGHMIEETQTKLAECLSLIGQKQSKIEELRLYNGVY